MRDIIYALVWLLAGLIVRIQPMVTEVNTFTIAATIAWFIFIYASIYMYRRAKKVGMWVNYQHPKYKFIQCYVSRYEITKTSMLIMSWSVGAVFAYHIIYVFKII